MDIQYQYIYSWVVVCSYISGFSTAEYTVTGHVHSTIILNCSLDGTITWYGPAKNPPPPEAVYSWKNQLNAPDIPDNLRPRLSVVGDFNHGRYNLKIQKLQVTDQGLYMCELKGSVDKFRLKVIGDLTVEVSKTSYVGTIGGSVTLGCIVSSKTSPVSHVCWYFLNQSNGSYILLKPDIIKYSMATPKNPSLIIQNLELNDDGLYICSATNEAGVTGNSTTPTPLTVINNNKPDSTGKKIAYVFVSICCLLVLVIITILTLKKKKPIFLLQIAHRLQKVEDDDSKLWDAFVSFKSEEEDIQFVFQHLYPKLEKQLGFKLCIHHKDFLPGKAITANIIDAIANSRRTIMIISKEYLQGGYTTFEYEVAHTEMINSKSKHKIIPIFLDKFDSCQGLMDDTLKCIVQSVTYITWPKGTNQRAADSFWKRLELAMPKKSKKDRADCCKNSSLLRRSMI
ncbi:unnamed protein product [Mytilus coruscus]|uniref:Uncharacterized protein n=1 Tax=Mytilus coruscus TaxID=42192 RepID=A0A6J8EMH2_MYTCO|nr:unnamed protein product [Mytilus coruscus]